MAIKLISLSNIFLNAKYVNVGIIIGGYLSFIHFFYENIFLAILSAAVVAGEIYQLDLLKRYFNESERKKINQIIPHSRFILAFMVFTQVIGALLITSFIENFGYAFFGLLIWASNIFITIRLSAKFTEKKISRSKSNTFLLAFLIIFMLTILLGVGGHYILSSAAILIALNYSVVIPWKKIRQKKITKIALEIGNQKEKIEKVLILEWLKIGKSFKERILFGVLSHTVIILVLNIHFVEFDGLIQQLIAFKFSPDLFFVFMIILILFLTYQVIKRSWMNWKMISIPYFLLCGLLLFYILRPESLPLYDGILSLTPSHEYLEIVGLQINEEPIYHHGAYTISTILPMLYLGFVLSLLLDKKAYIVDGYRKLSNYEFETAFSFLMMLCISFVIAGFAANVWWPESILIIYYLILFGFSLVVVITFISLGYAVKDKTTELTYYVNRRMKEKLQVDAMLGRAFNDKKIGIFYGKKQLLHILGICIITLIISFGMIAFVQPPEEPMAYESYTPVYTIKNFMTFDGKNYSYGNQGFLEVDSYVLVNFTVFSNDAMVFSLQSTGKFVSDESVVVGPNTSLSKDYLNLEPGRYQLIYYIREDGDDDNEARIHIDVLRSPKKLMPFGPELGALLIAMVLFGFIRPSYMLARLKKKLK